MLESGRSDDSFVISVGSLYDELKSDRLSRPPSPCIFKTRSTLSRHEQTAFLPNRFSIGPMHSGKQNLVASEKIKIKCLNGLLSRMTTSRWPLTTSDEEAKEIKHKKILTELLDAVGLIHENARACYAEHDFATKLGRDEFIEAMVLDGCFIIELFRKNAEEVKELNDPIFSMSCMLQFLHHDLIFLENQILWLVS